MIQSSSGVYKWKFIVCNFDVKTEKVNMPQLCLTFANKISLPNSILGAIYKWRREDYTPLALSYKLQFYLQLE
jgi:hypothetical protein